MTLHLKLTPEFTVATSKGKSHISFFVRLFDGPKQTTGLVFRGFLRMYSPQGLSLGVS